MKAPGVALVGVAEDVLDVRLRLAGELPLESGGEAGASATAEAAAQDFAHHLIGRHLREHLGQGLVALAGDVLLYLERVDDPRVAQDDLDLAVEELHVAHLGDRAVGARGVAHQPVDHPAFQEVLFDDLVDVLDLDVLIEDAVRVHEDDGSDGAGAEAAGLDHPGLAVDAQVFELLGERGTDLKGAGRDAPTAGADKYVVADLIHIRSLAIRWRDAYDEWTRYSGRGSFSARCERTISRILPLSSRWP